jgi:hypothetical protein
MSLKKRKKLFIDRPVQGAFFLRIVLCWFSGLLAFGLLVLSLEALQQPGRPFLDQFRLSLLVTQYAPEVIASLFILPLVLYDTLVLTHRFTGPMYRLRCAMRALAAGEKVKPLKFRDRDFWHEAADEFNAIVERQEELKRQLAAEIERHKPVSFPQDEEELEKQLAAEIALHKSEGYSQGELAKQRAAETARRKSESFDDGQLEHTAT